MLQSSYKRAFVVSTVLHTVIVGGVLLLAFFQGCLRPKDLVIPIEFTVAVATSEETAPEPTKPDDPPPEPPKEPLPPPELPPEPDRVPDPRQVDKPPDKPKNPVVKPPPKPPEKPPDKPKKPVVEKGKRVFRGPDRPHVKQTLSDEEVRKWLGKRVRAGEVDALPSSEQALNFMMVRNALYDAWNQPPRRDAGSRPAEVEFKLDAAGRISEPRITVSSGSPLFDASVLEAVRTVDRIPGLSARFLQQYRTLSVEFKLQL